VGCTLDHQIVCCLTVILFVVERLFWGVRCLQRMLRKAGLKAATAVQLASGWLGGQGVSAGSRRLLAAYHTDAGGFTGTKLLAGGLQCCTNWLQPEQHWPWVTANAVVKLL